MSDATNSLNPNTAAAATDPWADASAAPASTDSAASASADPWATAATPADAVPAFEVLRPMALSKASDMLLFDSLSSGAISACNGAD